MSVRGRIVGAVRVVRAVVLVAGVVAAALGLRASAVSAQSDTTAKPDSAAPAVASPQGVCFTCGPGDNPPTVSITPATGTLGTASQTVTVDWCDDNALVPSTRQITFNGTNRATVVGATFTLSAGISTPLTIQGDAGQKLFTAHGPCAQGGFVCGKVGAMH